MNTTRDTRRPTTSGNPAATRSGPPTQDGRIVFVDLETTGLHPSRHHIWEAAIIIRDPGCDDIEHEWQIPADLPTAEPAALRIGRFYERRALKDDLEGLANLAEFLARTLNDAHLAAAVPSFDAGFLSRFLRSHSQCPAWHHRLICVESMAALGRDTPYGLDNTAVQLGVTFDPEHGHTALLHILADRGITPIPRTVPNVRVPSWRPRWNEILGNGNWTAPSTDVP